MERNDKSFKILQLSDIHLGGDYEGQFDTKAQLEATCIKAREYSENGEGYDLVVITGDIADCPYEGLYQHVFESALSLCDSNKRLLVTPGNHDDRPTLVKVLHSMNLLSMDSNDIDDLLVPGRQAYSCRLGENNIVMLDTGAVKTPYEGISRIYARHKINADFQALLFTHCPATVPGKLYHRFMNDKMLDPDMFDLVRKFTSHYFCGHLHHMASINGPVRMHICPAVQCQIDPYSSNCHPTAISGFRVIDYASPFNFVNFTDYIIND